MPGGDAVEFGKEPRDDPVHDAARVAVCTTLGWEYRTKKIYPNVGSECRNEWRQLRTEAGWEWLFMGKEAGSMTRKMAAGIEIEKEWVTLVLLVSQKQSNSRPQFT